MIRSVIIILLISSHRASTTESSEDKLVNGLVREWAPLVWLAPGEKFRPIGVPEFLEHVQAEKEYLQTRVDIDSLLKNESSFLYGRDPVDGVPIYALVTRCPGGNRALSVDDELPPILSNEVGKVEANLEGNRLRKLHFHVTYWMFYPFSEGKAVCVLDLGFFGTWPIPSVGGVCLGQFKEYGSHVGDWEHMSLYFQGHDHPVAMYVSAHDAGAFYRYDARSGTFVYQSQETRKGIFQKPIFPDRVVTSDGSHPVLFSAKGSHGLWTAPGKHKFLRLPRLYDESGFGTPWPTWQSLQLLSADKTLSPSWMTFQGKWGNPRGNCHPLVRLGFNICEYVDGPTGIPTKKGRLQCQKLLS